MDTATNTDTLAAMRDYQRRSHEKAFEATIRDYIVNAGRKYQYGGIPNLVYTLQKVLETLSDEKEADYYGEDMFYMAFCAKQIEKAALEIDVPANWRPE